MEKIAVQRLDVMLVISLALWFALHPGNATAQDDDGTARPLQSDENADVELIEEILVTATKRDALVQDVPFSINVQSERDIQRQNSFNLEDLSLNIPGLSIQNLGPGQSVVNIRGISSGQIVRDQPGVKEQVGIYLDETPISLSLFTPDLDLFDVSRVETLRGPQGTLFGSGSIGGTVRYITNPPELNESAAKAEVDANALTEGSTGGHFKTAINAPLGNTAAARLVTYGTKLGGFIDALRPMGRVDKDVDDGSRYGMRAALLWEPTDSFSVTPRVVYQDMNLGGFNRDEVFNLFAPSLSDRQQFLSLDEVFADELLIFDTVIKWAPDGLPSVTYAFSQTRRDILVSRDASALSGSVGVDIGLPEVAVRLPANLRDTTDLEQMTHELRFSSEDDRPIQWVVGAFFSQLERIYGQRLPTPGWDSFYVAAGEPLGPLGAHDNGFDTTDSPYVSRLTYDLTQVALFGEATYAATSRLDLTAGLRWYQWEEDKTFNSGGGYSNHDAQTQAISVDADGIAPRFLMSYALADRWSVNAQVSQGFRLGGVNDPLNRDLCGEKDYETFGGFQEFQDETLWNYELGTKASLNGVTLSGAVFYNDIENLGVNVDAGGCSSRVTISVPRAHTMGAELEVSVKPMEALLVTLAGSYLEAEFDSTIGDPETTGIRAGNRIPSVPDWQVSAAATYSLPGLLGADDGYVSASWQLVGERVTQPRDQELGGGRFAHNLPFGNLDGSEMTELDLVLDPYSLINLTAGLSYETWELQFYVKNVTDENPKLSFDRERGGRARLAYRVGLPRTFGMVARMAF